MAKRRPEPGSVSRTKAGTWRVRVEMGRDADGRRRVMRGTYATRAEAEAARARMVAEMGASPRMGGRTTLAE